MKANKLSALFVRAKNTIVKYSPEILLVLGVTGTAVSGALAHKAYVKSKVIADEAKASVEKIADATVVDQVVEGDENSQDDVIVVEYTPEQKSKDTALVKMKAAGAITVQFLAPVAIGAASVAAVISSHHIMSRRLAALSMAYSGLSAAFTQYRNNVIATYGEEIDTALRHNDTSKIKCGNIVVDEDNQEIVNTGVACDDGTLMIFDDTCAHFSKAEQYNLCYIDSMINQMNMKLRLYHELFVNDIRREFLGQDHIVPAGQSIGWKYHPEKCDHIDFNIVERSEMDDTTGEEKVWYEIEMLGAEPLVAGGKWVK